MTKNTIQFYSDKSTEILRLSKDGIWANPDVPADDVAKLVLEAIDYNIKVLVKKAVEDEREACAKVCAEASVQAMDFTGGTFVGGYFAKKIIARGDS